MGLPPSVALSPWLTVTVTLYWPGSAPSSVLKVVSRKVPSDSVRPLADRPLPPSGTKTTVAPGTGLSSRVTIPWNLTGLPLPPQPRPTTREATARTPRPRYRLAIREAPQSSRRLGRGRKRQESARPAGRPGGSRQGDRLAVILDAELDVGRLVDR